jgi:hypothetical protein
VTFFVQALAAYESALICSPDNQEIRAKIKGIKEQQKASAQQRWQEQQQARHRVRCKHCFAVYRPEA